MPVTAEQAPSVAYPAVGRTCAGQVPLNMPGTEVQAEATEMPTGFGQSLVFTAHGVLTPNGVRFDRICFDRPNLSPDTRSSEMVYAPKATAGNEFIAGTHRLATERHVDDIPEIEQTFSAPTQEEPMESAVLGPSRKKNLEPA